MKINTFLSLCCCLSMKLVVNVISLFFSDKSVPIDGYQGNANPIFISIILILCIIYIYYSYTCLPLKSSLKDVVFSQFQSEIPETLSQEASETKPDLSKRAQSVCQLHSRDYYTILLNIVNIFHASLYVYYISLVIFTFEINSRNISKTLELKRSLYRTNSTSIVNFFFISKYARDISLSGSLIYFGNILYKQHIAHLL